MLVIILGRLIKLKYIIKIYFIFLKLNLLLFPRIQNQSNLIYKNKTTLYFSRVFSAPHRFLLRRIFSSPPPATALPPAGAHPSGLPSLLPSGAVDRLCPSLPRFLPFLRAPLPLAASDTAVADVGLLSDHRPRLIAILLRPDRALTTAVISTAGDSAAAGRCPPLWMMPPRVWPPRGWEVDGKELTFIREAHRVQVERVELNDVGTVVAGL